MAIITVEEIKNETGFDLAQMLGLETPQQAERWLNRIEREVLSHIGKYAWGGIEQAKKYLTNAKYREVIKEALMEQIIFLQHNNFVDGNMIANATIAKDTLCIAPLCHDILLNAGLLYVGREGA